MAKPDLSNLKGFGYANDWKETPAEVVASRAAGHKVVEYAGPYRHTHLYVCEEGGWYYYTDSSD